MNRKLTSLLGLSLLLTASSSFAKVEDFQNLIVESTAAKETLSKSLKTTVQKVDRPANTTGSPSARENNTLADDSMEPENIVVPSNGLDVSQKTVVAKRAAKQTDEQQKARVSSEITDDGN